VKEEALSQRAFWPESGPFQHRFGRIISCGGHGAELARSVRTARKDRRYRSRAIRQVLLCFVSTQSAVRFAKPEKETRI